MQLVNRDGAPNDTGYKTRRYLHLYGREWLAEDVDNIARDSAPADLLNEGNSSMESPIRCNWVQSALEAEGRVAAQSMAPCGTTRYSWVEISSLNKNICRLHRHASIQTSHDTTYA